MIKVINFAHCYKIWLRTTSLFWYPPPPPCFKNINVKKMKRTVVEKPYFTCKDEEKEGRGKIGEEERKKERKSRRWFRGL